MAHTTAFHGDLCGWPPDGLELLSTICADVVLQIRNSTTYYLKRGLGNLRPHSLAIQFDNRPLFVHQRGHYREVVEVNITLTPFHSRRRDQLLAADRLFPLETSEVVAPLLLFLYSV